MSRKRWHRLIFCVGAPVVIVTLPLVLACSILGEIMAVAAAGWYLLAQAVMGARGLPWGVAEDGAAESREEEA
jgi:hypothetical protein